MLRSPLEFRPEPGVNVLVGDNGVGKTSVLEALGYLGMMKSFRGPFPTRHSCVTVRRAAVRSRWDRRRCDRDDRRVRTACSRGARTVLDQRQAPTAHARRAGAMSRWSRSCRMTSTSSSAGRRSDATTSMTSSPAGCGPRPVPISPSIERTLRAAQHAASPGGPARRTRSPSTCGTSVSPLRVPRSYSHTARAVASALQPHLVEAYDVVGGAGDLAWAYAQHVGEARRRSSTKNSWGRALVKAPLEAADPSARTWTCARPRWDHTGMILACSSMADRPGRVHPRASSGPLRSRCASGAHRVIEDDARHASPILLLDDVFSELDTIERRSRAVAHSRPDRFLSQPHEKMRFR